MNPRTSDRRSTQLFDKWNKVRKETGFRSGYELDVSRLLPQPWVYEPQSTVPYTVHKIGHYLPDFLLPAQAIVLEVKGRFSVEDRRKMLLVKQQHPDLDIRILFQNKKQRITTLMTAEDWCKRAGFPCAQGPAIPDEWKAHKPSERSRAAFDELFGSDCVADR